MHYSFQTVLFVAWLLPPPSKRYLLPRSPSSWDLDLDAERSLGWERGITELLNEVVSPRDFGSVKFAHTMRLVLASRGPTAKGPGHYGYVVFHRTSVVCRSGKGKQRY